MISTDNLCMSCMREIGNAKQCPYCGYHVDSPQISPYLPVRTPIVNRYLVGKLLEYNGEGATYIGWDLVEKKAVNIREFIPDSISMRTTSDLTLKIMPGSEITFRDCNQSFVEMWNKLARLRGLSALISVTDVVEDHGTSFAIYDYTESITLREFLLNSKTGYVPWEKARQLLMPILSTLGTLHTSGIIHRGISPTTLIIGADGKVRITGFSIWQARTARGDLNAQLFPGYSALEQYGFEGQQGPWTDIYSFGAVLYRTLIGSDPIEAPQRVTNDRLMVPGKFAEQLPAYVINGLINSLQILPEDRTRSIEQLRAELSASPIAAAASEQYVKSAPVQQIARPAVPAPPPQAPGRAAAPAPARSNTAAKKSNDKAVILIAAGASILACLVILFVLSRTVLRDQFDSLFAGSVTTSDVSKAADAELVEVPNATGKSFDQAYKDYGSKFELKSVEENSDTATAGYIFKQDPQPGSKVPKGSVLTVYVSKGIKMVNLSDELVDFAVGSAFESARGKLLAAGFTTVSEKKLTADEAKAYSAVLPGTVVKIEGMKANKDYAYNTSIVLCVIPEPETTLPEETTAAVVIAPVETQTLAQYPDYGDGEY